MVLRTDLVRRLTARAEGTGANGETSLAEPPEGRLRRESWQRLQFGLGGVATMFLLVGLANVIESRADMADAATVPEAMPEPQVSAGAVEDDPLVSAGVVPGLPTAPAPAASPAAQPATSGQAADASPPP